MKFDIEFISNAAGYPARKILIGDDYEHKMPGAISLPIEDPNAEDNAYEDWKLNE